MIPCFTVSCAMSAGYGTVADGKLSMIGLLRSPQDMVVLEAIYFLAGHTLKLLKHCS
jgi:hypothetical protein